MFIVKKEINGQEYYYLRGSKREEGKVKAINVAYLGKDKMEADKKAKEIMKKMEGKEDQNVKKNKSSNVEKTSEKEFISFVQESGLIWGPEPEIYGGLAGFYTYGPIGKLLKNKVENSVRRVFNANGLRETEGPTVLPDEVWKASGHLETFSDPVIKTKDGKKYVSGGTKLVIENNKLKDLKIEKPLGNFDLEMFNE